MACSAALSPCSEACQCPMILALTWSSPSIVALLKSAGRAGLSAPEIVAGSAALKLSPKAPLRTANHRRWPLIGPGRGLAEQHALALSSGATVQRLALATAVRCRAAVGLRRLLPRPGPPVRSAAVPGPVRLPWVPGWRLWR